MHSDKELQEQRKRVNTGVCSHRLQTGKPAFFVNWIENGENRYEFFKSRFVCESFKTRLLQEV